MTKTQYILKADPSGYGGFVIARDGDRAFVPVSLEDVEELGATSAEIMEAQSGKRVICSTGYGGNLASLIDWMQ